MGSTGAFLESGGFAEQGWKQVGTSHGIKILQKILKRPNENPSLPPYSNTPGTAYLIYRKTGKFYMLRQYGEDRKPFYDLEVGVHNGKESLHIHYYENGNRSTQPEIIASEKTGILNQTLYNKYKKFLKGVSYERKR